MNLPCTERLIPALLKTALPFMLALVTVRLIAQSRGQLSFTLELWVWAELLGLWLAALFHLYRVHHRGTVLSRGAVLLASTLLLIFTCLTLDFVDTPERLLSSATYHLLLLLGTGLFFWHDLTLGAEMTQWQMTQPEREVQVEVVSPMKLVKAPRGRQRDQSKQRKQSASLQA